MPVGPNGGYWLAIHVANLFGVDKVSFADRVKWTYDHSAELIDSALAPLDGDRFWLTADSPWMALAAIFDFVGFLQNGEAHVSHLPIPLDGSNSGLQHFSAMLRDPVGGAAVNLVPADQPQDVYGTVAARCQAIVDASNDPAAEPWKGGKVTRKVAKRPTMTFVYSATRYGTQDMILETLKELDADGEPYLGGADNYEAAQYLSYVMFDAVAEVVSAASDAMAWLRRVATIAAGYGHPLWWTAPDGLPVLQHYTNPYRNSIQVHWQGKRLVLGLRENGDEISRRGQANGVAPNFVHTMDGAHLRAAARRVKEEGITSLAVIHDSFATHAARTDDLSRILRETLIDQYRPDVLRGFYEEVRAQLPEDAVLPEPPTFGSLNLEDIRSSQYVFA